MNNFIRRKTLSIAVKKGFSAQISSLRFWSGKDSVPPPPSAEPPPPPPTNEEPLPCPPPPPPCGPPCPPPICSVIPDPNNPCNYTFSGEPGEFDMTKIKKLQCLFQEDNDLDVFLKRGRSDVIIYHTVTILQVVGLIRSFVALYYLVNI